MLQGSYSWRYYYNQTAPTYSVLPGYTINGAGLYFGWSAGFGSADANGGSMILSWAQPNANIRSTLGLTLKGGTLVHYHRASSDAMNGPTTSQGSYVAVELQNIQFNGSTCTASIVGVERVGNVITQLFSQPVGCHQGAIFETFVTPNNTVGVRMMTSSSSRHSSLERRRRSGVQDWARGIALSTPPIW